VSQLRRRRGRIRTPQQQEPNMKTDPPAPTPSPHTEIDPRAVLQQMLDGLGLQTKVDQYTMDGSMLLHIATVEPGRLIGKHGQTLNELQFLLNRILQRSNPEIPRVIVDCERYRERQRDELIAKVVTAAEKVRRWGEPVRIGPFSAFDRRIIHLHVQQDPELEAISEGDESAGNKKIIIRLKNQPA
jgi:spoIIIJ-associated protein